VAHLDLGHFSTPPRVPSLVSAVGVLICALPRRSLSVGSALHDPSFLKLGLRTRLYFTLFVYLLLQLALHQPSPADRAGLLVDFEHRVLLISHFHSPHLLAQLSTP
jgi:hypothetical protein